VYGKCVKAEIKLKITIHFKNSKNKTHAESVMFLKFRYVVS